MNCLTDFAGSRTIAVGTTVFFARFVHHVIYFLHSGLTQKRVASGFTNYTRKKSDNFIVIFKFNFADSIVFQLENESLVNYLSCWYIQSFYRFCCQYTYLDSTFVFDFNRLDRQEYGEGPGHPHVTHIY